MKKNIESLEYGKKYSIRIKDQLVEGIFIRKVKKCLFFTRYEFSTLVHTRDFDYNKEYEVRRIHAIKRSDVLQPIDA